MMTALKFSKELDPAEKVKQDLAKAYQILAHLGYDDLTYTHLSARVPGEDSFYIYPLGMLFCEVTPDSLLHVSLAGEVLDGQEAHYNKTGYIMHGAIYQNRPDLNAIFHLHTIAGVAVSAMQCGLLPISQFAMHFYESLSEYEYDALALDPVQHGEQLVKDLGRNKAMLLRNHGTLACGETVQEAMFYTNFLEKACQVQCQVLASQKPYTLPTPEVCRRAKQDMLVFEDGQVGLRDWQALVRRYHL